MKSIKFSIGTRLLLGFSFVLVLTILFGLLSLKQISTLTSFTERMHDHPMAVSNAVRDIQTDVARIQFVLQKYFTISDSLQKRLMFEELKSLEDDIDSNFRIIRERFLGNLIDVDRANNTFKELKPLINDVVNLFQTDQKTDAIEMINKRNLVFNLERLSDQVEEMSLFANGKSEEFYRNARSSSTSILRTSIIFLVLIILVSFLIGSLISLSVTRPLTKLIGTVRKMAVGNNDISIDIKSNDEIGLLASSLKEMQTNLLDVIVHAGKIATGDYSGTIPLRSGADKLAESLNIMTKSLNELKETNAYQDWVKTGQNLLSEKMRGDLTVGELADSVISFLAEYVEAPVGALYAYDSKEEILWLAGSYAYSGRSDLSDRFIPGEGLIGQVALEMKMISIENIPENYLIVSSGLGKSEPAHILAFPFTFNSRLKGVIELGSFNSWNKRQFDLFESMADMIGVSFNSSETRNSMEELVKQQEEQAKELQAANEELEEKTERLTSSEERLRAQQEELKATNEELEEKTEYLQSQKDEIDRKNQELQIVQEEIIEKAKDLENSSRYKSEFLANMSHELRTPLNSLLILAKDLMNNRNSRLTDQDVQSAEIIYNSGNELLLLINEILDLAKIESGKMTMDIQDLSLQNITENLNDLFASVAVKKGIGLNIEIDKKAPLSIRTDKQKVGQILKNLLSNALKFTNEGSVHVRFTVPDTEHLRKAKGNYDLGSVLIEVIDTGIGIAAEDLPTIFEAFKQVDGSSSREFGGTGLGLSISRELASLLGGEILLTSQLGKGTNFALLLPRSLAMINKVNLQETEESPVIPEVILRTSEDIFIADDRDNLEEGDKVLLIIEDDKNFANVLYTSCREMNFKSIVTDTGESGITLAGSLKPDAIILDVKLPGMDGLQVLDRLKFNSETRHIPIHVMSIDDKEDDVKAKGVLGFLRKPIDRESLDKMFIKINKFLEKKVKDLLIVEDNENLRKSIEVLIGNSDVVKTSVSTGAKALSLLEKKQFDCMILDLSLPDIRGFELLEKLEKMDQISKPPVIIYTGKELSFEEEMALRKYTSSIIIKGVQSEERLLDETSLFLHRIISDLPAQKQKLLSKVYNKEKIFKDKKILVVDDDMRNLYAVSKVLEDQGMIVSKAADGMKALEYLNSESDAVDLILMDIMMPVLDGYETMKTIRKDKKYRNLPILALTAKAMGEDRQKCLKAGANDYMVKPIDVDRLLSLMRVWLYK